MTTNSTNCRSRLRPLALVAMTLPLMLSCAGCVRSRLELQPSIHQGPLGNAVMMTLPAGTLIKLPTDEGSELFLNAFANEIDRSNGRNPAQLKAPLKICTPAWVAERDAAELELHKTINALRK